MADPRELSFSDSSNFAPDAHARASGEGSALALVTAALRQRVWITSSVLLFLALGLYLALTTPRKFTSVGSFIPEGQRQSAVTSIAAQFGISAPGADALNSAQFYGDLIRSPQFLRTVVEAQFPWPPPAFDSSRTLIEIYSPGGGSYQLRREMSIRLLGRNTSVSVAPRTGIVTVYATGLDPRLAQEIARRIIANVSEFNIKKRQGRAAAERAFVERRLEEMRGELRASENRLETFLKENRDFSRAPELNFAKMRLERVVFLNQQVYASLSQSLEQSKIDEVRDTPVISILGEPEVPALADPRGRLRLMIIYLTLGFAIGLALAVGVEKIRQRRTLAAPADVELAVLTDELRGHLRRGRMISLFFGGNGAKRQSNGGGDEAHVGTKLKADEQRERT